MNKRCSGFNQNASFVITRCSRDEMFRFTVGKLKGYHIVWKAFERSTILVKSGI